jgi:DNA-binding GntR family transcriptional regulator
VVDADDRQSRVVRLPLRSQIRQVLLDGLVSGRWRPGDRIVERQVAAEFDVSQAPVREALRELEALRLVTSVPNKGARVRDIELDDLMEIYPVRASLEGLAASLAVARLDGDVSELQRHADSIREAADKDDVAEQIRAGVAFHRAIVVSSGNNLLLSVWDSLGIEIWTNLSIRMFRTELHENADDHGPIVEAFANRDPAIDVLVRNHVMSYCHGSPRTPDHQAKREA